MGIHIAAVTTTLITVAFCPNCRKFHLVRVLGDSKGSEQLN
jgi:hypothetical protein